MHCKENGCFLGVTIAMACKYTIHDLWRVESVSSPLRPGGPLNSTDQVPVLLIPGGFHASDLLALTGDVNPEVEAVQEQEIAIIARWVAQFYASKEWYGQCRELIARTAA
jgi:hypothetical protein